MKTIVFISLLIFSLLLFGTLMYHNLEGWSLVNSLYFTVSTMATVGYGDIAPVTETGRLFTVFFILVGVGTMMYGVSAIFEHLVEKELINRFSRNFKKIRVRRGPRWNFGGRSEIFFKIKMFFKDLGEKIENYRNKKFKVK